MSILKSIYSKKYDGLYCIRTILGIKIITKPHHLAILTEILEKINSIEEKINRKLSNDNYIYTLNILGDIFYFEDSILSSTANIVANEINNGEYNNIFKLDLSNKLVVDIGANIGIVSILLAKKNPGIKIYAFEPLKENYECLLNNIKLNNIPEGVITVENKAVTKDGRNINMSINISNRGGSSIDDIVSVNSYMSKNNCKLESLTLEDIVNKYNIAKIDLLKIDCEGSEYEILYNTREDILRKVDYLVGEFHENKDLTDKYDIDKLCQYIEKYIPKYDVVKARKCFVM